MFITKLHLQQLLTNLITILNDTDTEKQSGFMKGRYIIECTELIMDLVL